MGNIYVADTPNNTIRKVAAATEAVTTLAGSAGMMGNVDGAGAAARFTSPVGVTYDGAGSLYVTDSINQNIRKVSVASGAVAKIAAGFVRPAGLVYDGAGSLYVCDPGLPGLLQVVLANGSVVTVRSALACNGIMYDGAGSLFATTSNTVVKISTATGMAMTLAGAAQQTGGTDGTGTAARFGKPLGAAYDGAGNAYVADAISATIRKIEVATGAVTTIAGYAGTVPIRGNIDGVGAKAAFWGPSGVAYDGAGNLYVADQDAQTIRKIVVATAQVTTLAGSPMMTGNTDGTGAVARFSNPIGATTDGAGNIYVADYRNGAIRQIVAATGAVTTLVTGLLSPTDVLWDGAGNLYVSEVGTGSIRKIVVATKAVSTAAAAGSPTGLALDGAGNLYFSDSGSRTVRKLAGGVVTTVVGTMGVRGVQPGPLPGGINLPWGLAWVPNQGLVICDYGENVIVMARGL